LDFDGAKSKIDVLDIDFVIARQLLFTRPPLDHLRLVGTRRLGSINVRATRRLVRITRLGRDKLRQK
jgi:hypothetical protein